jgi:hypothetical protein
LLCVRVHRLLPLLAWVFFAFMMVLQALSPLQVSTWGIIVKQSLLH